MTTAKALPQFVRDMLASPPRAGEGVNLYLYRLARVLHPYRTEAEICETLRCVTAGCGRIVPEREIQRAVERSKESAWAPSNPNPIRSAPPWPKVNEEQREAVIVKGTGLLSFGKYHPSASRTMRAIRSGLLTPYSQGIPFFAVGRPIWSLPRGRERSGAGN